MRWPSFLLLSLFLGLLQALAAQAPGLPPAAARLELLFLLALVTASHCEVAYIPIVCWWCGLLQDLSLGAHLGANTLLFLLASQPLCLLRKRGLPCHPLLLAGTALAATLAIGFLRPLLEYISLRPFALPGYYTGIAATAAATAAAAPILDLLLRHTPLRTWRTAVRNFGLPEAG